MNKLIKIKSDHTAEISVNEKLFENIRKANTWFTNKVVTGWAIFIFAIIDVAGFMQLMKLVLSDNLKNRIIMTAGLAVAFEVAPLYIGYALCLKCYGLGKRINNWILGFSSTACILGIIGNSAFRFMTMDVYKIPGTDEVDSIGMPVTILMCILPIITSLINLVIGCLSYDPLQFDLMRLSKKLAKLKLHRQQIKACLEDFNDEENLQNIRKKEEMIRYKKSLDEIYALQTSLKSYTTLRASGMYTIKKKNTL